MRALRSCMRAENTHLLAAVMARRFMVAGFLSGSGVGVLGGALAKEVAPGAAEEGASGAEGLHLGIGCGGAAYADALGGGEEASADVFCCYKGACAVAVLCPGVGAVHAPAFKVIGGFDDVLCVGVAADGVGAVGDDFADVFGDAARPCGAC